MDDDVVKRREIWVTALTQGSHVMPVIGWVAAAM
jgi:hypothetical protein